MRWFGFNGMRIISFMLLLVISDTALANEPNFANLGGQTGGADVDALLLNMKDKLFFVKDLILNASALIGLCIFGIALFGIYKNQENPARYSLKASFSGILAGVLLMAPMSTAYLGINTFDFTSNSFSANGGCGSISTLGYVENGCGSYGLTHADAIFLFVGVVGLFAVLKGVFIVYKHGREEQGASLGKAATHIIGGSIALNFTIMISVLEAIPVIGGMIEAITT